ncbi:MAG: cell division protein ZipA [Gammaproteobacteria bacterium]|nr:cell division protein ZipA [Gammaproteobacteria bacterium]
MSARELVILFLGFVIILVILRGLYVALQARRGQIRMAIDKNIPQDVDLDELEMTELPSGGARIVERSLEEVNSQNRVYDTMATEQAAFDLEGQNDSEGIPVLEDTANYLGNQEELDQTEKDNWEKESDTGSVLFEYTEQVPTAGIEPGGGDTLGEESLIETAEYGEWGDEPTTETEESDEWEDEPATETEDTLAESSAPAQSTFMVEDSEANFNLEEGFSDTDAELNSGDQRLEPTFDQSIADGFEEFSMTAGERIGGHRTPADLEEFNSIPDDITAEQLEKPKRRSFLSMFSRGKEPEPIDLAEAVGEDTTVVKFESEALTEQVSLESESTAFEGSSGQVLETSEVVVINVMAKKGFDFVGDDLMQVLISNGLRFGEMNIFHKRLGNDSKSVLVFSVANILNPGTFDLNNMDSFRTLGISLFLALPTAINNGDAFEQMLTVAQQVSSSLDGELKDDHRNVMTAQTIEHYRQRISDFELRQLKAAGGHG